MSEVAHEVARIYNVSEPVIHYSCGRTCPSSMFCQYAGCYRHIDNSINFKSTNATPTLVAHEMGHYIYHTKNGYRGHLSHEDSVQCESYAKEVEHWYASTYGVSVPNTGEDIIPLLLSFGVGVLASLTAIGVVSLMKYFSEQ